MGPLRGVTASATILYLFLGSGGCTLRVVQRESSTLPLALLMRVDRAAVAGFFEDLPVLLFVLAGVMTLVVSSTFAAERFDAQKRQKELDESAQDIADAIVRCIELSAGSNGLPLVSAVSSMNISNKVAQTGGCDFAASVFIVHPLVKLVIYYSTDPDALPKLTGSSLRFMNAIDDQGEIIIVEVRTVVW